mgnify:CR=1 FL=1
MAGQSRQALRTRIKSVQSTRKITKAMEMIANAKLVRSRSKMEANREYAQKLQDTVDEIVMNNPDAESQYVIKTDNPHKVTIIFTSDLGLCGGYNANVMKMANEVLDKDTYDSLRSAVILDWNTTHTHDVQLEKAKEILHG